MILYNSAVSGNCYKVRLLSAQLGIALKLQELDVVDRSNRPALLGDLNPALRVPTLILEDGRALPESNAIITYLADDTPLLPEDRYDRARVLGWMFFEQYEIEPNLAVLRFFKLFGIEPNPAIADAKRQAGTAGLEALERGLGDRDWLVGNAYSVADISLYGYTHCAADAGFELDRYPSIRAWLKRVREQPGHITIDQ